MMMLFNSLRSFCLRRTSALRPHRTESCYKHPRRSLATLSGKKELRLSGLKSLPLLAVTAIILITALPSSSHAQDVTDSLVARWQMDVASGNIPDATGNGYTANVAGGWNYLTTGGQFGGSLQNNGGDIDTPHDPAFVLTEGSVSLWFKTSTLSHFAQRHLFAKDSVGDNDGDFNILVDNAGAVDDVTFRITANGAQDYRIKAESDLVAGQWHYIVVTFGPEGMKLYFDGRLEAAKPNITTGMENPTESVDIGNVRSAGEIANGDELDEVRVYNRVLTGSEIAGIYNAATGSNINANTLGYFVMIGNQPTNAEANEFDGDLGGLDGANTTCLNWLETYDWLGKTQAQANGMLTAGNVQAWLCDDTTCQDMEPNSTYAFAKTEAGETDFGGSGFTTDASGYYPTSEDTDWQNNSDFNRNTAYWTGRAADFSPRVGETCNNWTDNTAGEDGRKGDTTGTDDSRWFNSPQACNTTDQFICFVNPIEPMDVCNSSHAGKILYETSARVMKYCDGTSWINMGKDASVIHGEKSRGEDYTPNAVEFDGTNDYISATDAELGISDGTRGTFSAWVNTTHNSSNQHIYGATAFNHFRMITNGSINFSLFSTTNTNLINMTSTTAIPLNDGNWHHILASWNTTSGSTDIKVYIDDIDVTTATTVTAGTIDYTRGRHCINRSNCPNTFTGPGGFTGQVADYWIDFGTYIDLSIEANRRRFITASGQAVNLGADGSGPTGTAPDIFLSGDTATWHTNDGSGGGFTENGALTDAATNPQGTTAEKLIGWWKLDETSGLNAADASDNSNNGTFVGDTSVNSISGPVNTALTFDGTDDVIILPDDPALELDLPATISAWIKPDTYSGSDLRGILTTNRHLNTFSHSGFWIQLNSTDLLAASYGDNTTCNAAGRRSANGSTVIQENVWQHITAVYRGPGDVDIYVNGVADTGVTYSGTGGDVAYRAGSSGQIGILTDCPSAALEFPGSIDDVRIYNYALSAAEVEELYNASNVFYQPNAVDFDGTATYLEGPATPIGVTDGNQGTASFWFKLDSSGSDMTFMRNATARVIAEFDASNGGQIRFWGEDTSNTTLLNMGSDNFNGDTTSWHHVMASWDLSDSAMRHIYINGVADLDTVNYTTHVDGLIEYSNGYYRIGANALGNNMLDGQVADFWFDSDTYIDLSIEENRRKFLDENGNARFLGNNGELVTGTTPDIYLSGDTATWHTNDGASGGFTENGALTDAANAPSGEKQPRYCSNPTLPEGTLIYNSSDHVMQYCDGYRYIPLGPEGDGGSGCSNPAGSAGSLIFNTTFNTLQYCEGDTWVGIGDDPTVSVLAQGLIGHWTFDETTGLIAADSSGNGNDGTLENGLDAGNDNVPGAVGTALNFDGLDDRFRSAGPILNNSETEASVCIWINLDTNVINTDMRVLSNSAPSGWVFQIDDAGPGIDDYIVFRMAPTATVNSPDNFALTLYNNWTHVCGVFKGDEYIRLYANGAQIGENTTSIASSVEVSNARLWIGADGSGNRRVEGSLDDARIYNRALSASEILQLYQTTGNIASTSIGLVGHWQLDETSGTFADSSVNNNIGTQSGGVTYASTGVIGNAASFDGTDDYIPTTVSADHNFTGDFTLSAWIRHSGAAEAGSGDGWRIVSRHRDPGNDVYTMRVGDSSSSIANGGVEFLIRPDGSIYSVASTTNIKDGNWYLVTAVRRGSDIEIYINGTLENTTNSVSTDPLDNYTTQPFMIGRSYNNAEYFAGDIDDVRIYDRALSNAEIAELYQLADCPQSDDICADGSVFVGYRDYGSGDVKVYTTPTDTTGSSRWKVSGLADGDHISVDSDTDGRINAANLNSVITDFPAINLCENLTDHGHSDWYLPARSELSWLKNNTATINAATHWASSEASNTNARAYSGAGFQVDKDSGTPNVRCIRRD